MAEIKSRDGRVFVTKHSPDYSCTGCATDTDAELCNELIHVDECLKQHVIFVLKRKARKAGDPIEHAIQLRAELEYDISKLVRALNEKTGLTVATITVKPDQSTDVQVML